MHSAQRSLRLAALRRTVVYLTCRISLVTGVTESPPSRDDGQSSTSERASERPECAGRRIQFITRLALATDELFFHIDERWNDDYSCAVQTSTCSLDVVFLFYVGRREREHGANVFITGLRTRNFIARHQVEVNLMNQYELPAALEGKPKDCSIVTGFCSLSRF